MAKLLDAIQRLRKIEEVCSTKDEAPPVYLMDEIAELAKASPDAAQSVAESISKRLANKSPVVKYKALRLIRHLCNKGCSHFQRAMQRSAQDVRDCVHWKGESDPFKGDALNQRVRDTAKETVDVLFNSVAPAQPAQHHGVQSRIQGFGSGDSYAGGQGGRGSGGKMMGFGSAASAAPSAGGAGLGSGGSRLGSGGPGPGVGAAVSNLGSNVGSFLRSTFSKNEDGMGYLNPADANNGSYGAPPMDPPGHSALASGPEPPIYNMSSLGVGLSGNRHGAGGAGGGGGRAGGGGGFAPPQGMGRPAAAIAPGASEQQLVDEMCTPGGLRPAPDPADLRRFVEAASGMDGLRIAELLREKMAGPSWQQLLRALYALEAVLQQGMAQACGEVAVMFQSDPAPVRAALGHTQQSVRERAAKVLRLLLNEDQAAGAGGAAAAAASGMDLLGDLEPSPAAPAAAAAQPAHDDLFGGLDVPVPAAAPAAAAAHPAPVAAPLPPFPHGPSPTGPLPGGALYPSQPAAPAAAGGGAFAGVHAAAAPAATPAVPPPPQPLSSSSSRAPLDDFFSDLSLSGHPQVPRPQPTSSAVSVASGNNGSTADLMSLGGMTPSPGSFSHAQGLGQGQLRLAAAAGGYAPSGLGPVGPGMPAARPPGPYMQGAAPAYQYPNLAAGGGQQGGPGWGAPVPSPSGPAGVGYPMQQGVRPPVAVGGYNGGAGYMAPGAGMGGTGGMLPTANVPGVPQPGMAYGGGVGGGVGGGAGLMQQQQAPAAYGYGSGLPYGPAAGGVGGPGYAGQGPAGAPAMGMGMYPGVGGAAGGFPQQQQQQPQQVPSWQQVPQYGGAVAAPSYVGGPNMGAAPATAGGAQAPPAAPAPDPSFDFIKSAFK